MGEFIKDLSTLHFWLAVVVVGLLLEVGGHLLAKSIDKSLARTSSWWKFKSEAKTAKRQKLIEELRADPKKQILHLVRMATLFLTAWFTMTAACIFFSIISIYFILKGNINPPDARAANILFAIRCACVIAVFCAYAFIGMFIKKKNILREVYSDFNSVEKDTPDHNLSKGLSSPSDTT
jgi:ABC-type Mn2+/Zn2+ transport system permease subunit